MEGFEFELALLKILLVAIAYYKNRKVIKRKSNSLRLSIVNFFQKHIIEKRK